MDYGLLAQQLEALSEGEPSWLPLLSNASALLAENLDDINWAGFYLAMPLDDGTSELVLGPFQGKVACTHIAWGRGVCGDSASNSEIVIPLHRDGAVWGVLDIDSPSLARFSTEDEEGLVRFARILEEALASTR